MRTKKKIVYLNVIVVESSQQYVVYVHKGSCHIFDVSEISDLISTEENNPGSEVEIDIETVPKNLIKPGIKLPKNDKEWEQANDFFRNKKNDKRFNNRGYSLFFLMDIFLKYLRLIPNILK